MTWSQDQMSARAPSRDASVVSDETAEHPAKAVMTRRWEQRRAQASARWADITSSVVIDRAQIPGTPKAEPDSAAPSEQSAEHLLADMRQLEQKDAAESGILASAYGPAWLRNTPRAMLIVALVSNSLLLGLLYFGGFLS